MTTTKGHWRLDVYEGELRYASMPWRLRAANVLWQAERFARRAALPRKRHRGPVLNRLVTVLQGDNLITTSGKGVILDRLFGLASVGPMTQLAVGTSPTAAAVGDTSLTGQVLLPFDSTPSRAGLVVTAIATAGTGTANINWQELGAFNAAPTMLNRIAPIGPFNKTSAVSIVVTMTVTQS